MRGRFNPDTLSECPHCHKKPHTFKDTDGMCHIFCPSSKDDGSTDDTCSRMSNYPGDDTFTEARKKWESLVKAAKKGQK